MGDIFIPEDFKLLKLKKAEDDSKSDDDCCSSFMRAVQSDESPLQPGNLLDVQNALMNKTAALTITHTGTSVALDTPSRIEKELTEKQAIISLVGRHGLTEPAARELLKRAADRKKYSCRIKYADPYGSPMMVQDAPTAPAIPDPVMGGESIMNSNVPTQLGIDMGLPVADMSAMKTDRSIYNPNTAYDNPPMSRMGDPEIQGIVDAANSGQREVFDTAMIGGMLRSVRDDSLVDRYMGDLTKGLDKLGRILFMFYWHGDKFADRYGKADMPELEDSLRNAFEMLGDVILFLKQKQIGGDLAQNVDLSSVANS